MPPNLNFKLDVFFEPLVFIEKSIIAVWEFDVFEKIEKLDFVENVIVVIPELLIAAFIAKVIPETSY
jgi:hypothetical protein